ncbi:MAG: Ig-like domain-containing protein [Microgenomates group bacterium]
MTKKFLVSTADVYGYDSSYNLILSGKTLLDSSIETTLGNTDVRGGRGNQLQYVYYHTAEMNLKISDAQWNLDFLAANVGQSKTTGANIFQEETIVLNAGKGGSVTDTPLAVSGTTVYGWVTLASGVVERVTFSTKAFTTSGGAENESVCVRYYALDSAATSLTIPANVVPSVVNLVLVAQLASSDSSTNIIGEVQINVPKAVLSGAFTISLTPDGVASTPLNARALASSNVVGCADTPTYATIKEIIYNTNWYDNVVGLSIVGGDFTIASGTRQLTVYAIPSSGAAFVPPVADLTFASSDATKATVSAGGLVTFVASGTTTVKASITAATSIDANIVVTCS